MQNILSKTIDLTITIQQIAAPTFFEHERAAFVRERFLDEGLKDVSMDGDGNVYGRLLGNDPSLKPVVVSAHLDTVFPQETDLALSRQDDLIFGPGIGDNSLGVASLFGVLWQLKHAEVNLPADLWLVANVGEEGLGDLKGMKAVVERFGDTPRAYIILEGMSLGQIYHRGLGVRRFGITVETEGGHSWANFGTPSAIHELAAIIQRVTQLSVPESPRTTFNVGVISGGTTINTIAQKARMQLDLRSEDPAALAALVAQVEELVETANREGVKVQAEVIGDRPAGEIPTDHSLVQLAEACLEAQALTPKLNIGSTDANIPLSRGYPAVCIGLSLGGGAHTKKEFIDTKPLEKGLKQVAMLIERIYQEIV